MCNNSYRAGLGSGLLGEMGRAHQHRHTDTDPAALWAVHEGDVLYHPAHSIPVYLLRLQAGAGCEGAVCMEAAVEHQASHTY